MQTGLRPDEIQRRIREAKSWQEHSRLIFEVLHSPDKKDFQHLVEAYRSELKKAPTPLLRWALVNIVLEINVYAESSIDKYASTVPELRDVRYVFDELSRITKSEHRKVDGYLGMARAYRTGLPHPDLVNERVLKWREINGKKRPLEIYESFDNVKRWNRYQEYRDKVHKMDPANPYLSYWEASELSKYIRNPKRISLNKKPFLYYHESQLKQMSKEKIAAEGLKHATAAYEYGFKDFSPICGLTYIIYFAWHAKQHDEMRKWGNQLQPWIRQNPESHYVDFVRVKSSHNCPYLGELAQNK